METGENKDILKLTSKERFKLLRNLFILILFNLMILAFYILMMYLYKKADWISVIATVLLLPFSLFVSIYAVKYIKDLKNGEADIYSGTVTGKYSVSGGDSIDSHYLVMGSAEHQISFKYYMKIKENDFVTIRKAPLSKIILTVLMNNKSV